MLDWVPLNDKGEIHTWQIEQTRLLECSPWKPGKSALGRGLCMARKEDLNAAELQALGEQLKVLSALADDYGLLAQQYRSGALDRAAYIAAAQQHPALATAIAAPLHRQAAQRAGQPRRRQYVQPQSQVRPVGRRRRRRRRRSARQRRQL